MSEEGLRSETSLWQCIKLHLACSLYFTFLYLRLFGPAPYQFCMCALLCFLSNRPKARDFFFPSSNTSLGLSAVARHQWRHPQRKKQKQTTLCLLAHLPCLQLRIGISHKDGRQKQPWFVPHISNRLMIREIKWGTFCYDMNDSFCQQGLITLLWLK